MSSKGLSFPAFYNGMESNATTYVICGIAAFIIWNIVSYAKNSGGSKEEEPPESDDRRNGFSGGVVSDEVPNLFLTPAGNVNSNDHLGNGYVDHDEGSEPARDRGETKRNPPAKRDQRNGFGAVATVVSTAASSPDGDFKISHLGNGIARRIKSEPGHDQDVSVELRPSEATQDRDELLNGPAREEQRRSETVPLAVAEEGRGDNGACRPSAGRRRRGEGWKGEGPHVVCLLNSGWTNEDLDHHQRPIEVYAWFDLHKSCDCSYEFAVTLQDKNRRRITEYQHGPTSYKPTKSVFKKVSVVFQNYGAGVRYVTYNHRRRKSSNEECKGHCVSEMYSGLRKLLKIYNLK